MTNINMARHILTDARALVIQVESRECGLGSEYISVIACLHVLAVTEMAIILQMKVM